MKKKIKKFKCKKCGKFLREELEDCVICGEPCTRRYCRKCFTKNKFKGQVSRLRSIKKKK